MRIGLALPHYDFSIPQAPRFTFEGVAEVAVRAERLGFDSLWVSDHFFASLDRYGGGPARHGSLEPLTTLAALGVRTSRVRLGTLVLSTGFRHPALVAKAATTVDLLSGGRLDLGLGAGWYEHEYGAFGYAFGSTDERFALLDEATAVIARLFEGGPADHGGPRFSLTGAFNHPLPAQRPRPPIWIGGKGGPRLLRLAARRGDGWNTVWRWTPEAYADRVSAARAICEDLGRDPATLRLSVGLFCVVGEDETDLAQRWERIGGALPAGVGDATSLEDLRRDGLVGTPEQVLERLARFAELGVEEVIVSPAPVWFCLPDPSMLDLLAERVLPAVRAA